jgi:nucleoside-diphosphate-sugar epimerase
MKILITGGTGFIGNHVVEELLKRKHEIVVTGTNREKAQQFSWFKKVEFIELDINNSAEFPFEKIKNIDKLIHLAWSGLPNYKDLFHLEENLMPQYFFIKKIIEIGITDITITGTCFEYGMKSGGISADTPSDPQNPYALAKDTLRKMLQQLQTKMIFDLKWIRLFYMYGKGQSSKSILSQLNKAIEDGEKVFNMSKGEQLRDYLPVEEVAKNIINLSLGTNRGIILNCCSGTPISILELVENFKKEKKSTIELNLGYYPYTDYEPFAFWGKK